MKTTENKFKKWMWSVLILLFTQTGCQFLGALPFEKPIANTPPMILIADIKEPTLESKFVIEKTRNPEGFTTFKVPWAFDPDQNDYMHGYWLLDHDVRPQVSYLDQAKETRPQKGIFDPFKKRGINFTFSLSHAKPELKVGKQLTLAFYLTDQKVDPVIFQKETSGASGTIKWPEGVGYDRIDWLLQVE